MKTRPIPFACLLLFLLAGPGAKAQIYDEPFVLHSFGDNVNVRINPDRSAAVIKKLRIAEPVKLMFMKYDSAETINGVTANWCSVITGDGTEGWVWGGMLSLYSGEVNLIGLGKGTLLIGLTPSSGEGMMEVRFVQNGKLVKSWKQEFGDKENRLNPGFNEYESGRRLAAYSSDQFSPAMNLVRFQVWGGACSSYDDSQFYAWDGQNLSFAFATSVYYYEGESGDVQLVFPLDSGGRPNTVEIVRKDLNYNENATTEENPEEIYSSRFYVWRSEMLIEETSDSHSGAQSRDE